MKILKKISTIVLALIVVLSNTIVKAYDNSVAISKNIVIDANNSEYISLVNDLKNDNAVVYQQNIAITQEQFNTLKNKKDANNKYVEEQFVIIQQKTNELNQLQVALENLRTVAEKEGATEEEKATYETAKINFQSKSQELVNYNNLVDAQVLKNDSDFEKMVPGFDNTKWAKLTLNEKTTYENKYKYIVTDNTYFVIWIKVSLNGQEYYKYDIYCKKETENDKPKYCKIENGKYYNKLGKEVTKAEYEADCEEKKVCKIENGKYYNKLGKEVTEAEYKADCEEVVVNVCKIIDGKYYDNNGKEVTKAEYERACTTPENPKTGSNISYIYAVLITLVAISSYTVVKKYNKFSR